MTARRDVESFKKILRRRDDQFREEYAFRESQLFESQLKRMEWSFQIARANILATFTANGLALNALVFFAGRVLAAKTHLIQIESPLVWAAGAFAFGLVFAIFATFVGYYAQRLFRFANREQTKEPDERLHSRRAENWVTIAAGCTYTSVIFFLAGLLNAAFGIAEISADYAWVYNVILALVALVVWLPIVNVAGQIPANLEPTPHMVGRWPRRVRR